MEEIWKDIHGYKGIYLISNLGRVKVLERKTKDSRGRLWVRPEKILNGGTSNGYKYIRLHSFNKERSSKMYTVHRLVAKHFVPNENNKPQVNHINGVRDDNNVTNLEWVTNQENVLHGRRVLGHCIGEKNARAKTTELMALTILDLRKKHPCKTISKKFKLPLSRVRAICEGRTFIHLPRS